MHNDFDMQGTLTEAEEPLLDDFLTLDQEVMAEYFWKPAVSYLNLMAHITSPFGQKGKE